MIEIEHDRDNFLVCRVSGRLSKTDYEAALPELENAMRLRQGALRMMIVLEDFRGWDIGALWEELKFDAQYGDDFARIAVIGESNLEEWASRLAKPFSGSQMRYYDRGARRKRAPGSLSRPASPLLSAGKTRPLGRSLIGAQRRCRFETRRRAVAGPFQPLRAACGGCVGFAQISR